MSKIYAVLRNGKIGLSSGKWSGVDAANKHNCRIGNQKKNIDPSRSWANEVIGSTNLTAAIKQRLKDLKVKPSRKDAVVCREAILTTSPEFWGENWKGLLKNTKFKNKLEAWKTESLKFFTDKYGANVVQASVHLDEETPHIHVMFVPIVDRNNKPELNAKAQMSRQDLRQMQTEYANCMAKFGLERGEPVEKTGAKHEHFESYRNRKALEDKVDRLISKVDNLEQEAIFFRKKAVEQDKVIATLNTHIDARIQEGIAAQSEHLRLQYEEELDNIMMTGKRKTRLSLKAQPTPDKKPSGLASTPTTGSDSSFNM